MISQIKNLRNLLNLWLKFSKLYAAQPDFVFYTTNIFI